MDYVRTRFDKERILHAQDAVIAVAVRRLKARGQPIDPGGG